MGEKKKGGGGRGGSVFRWYQTKEKNVTISSLPPNLPLPSSILVPLLRSKIY